MQLAASSAQSRVAFRPATSSRRPVVCLAQKKDNKPDSEFRLHSFVAPVVLGALLTWGASPRPSNLGIQSYGPGIETLSLCPRSPNCIATSEELNDPDHYAPPLTYNPADGRGRKNPASQEQAMKELVQVVSTLTPDNFTPKIIKQTNDYLYAEYESPIMGFIDDVEFWFKPGPGSRVEYRSASRIGESDGNINRKRIRAIRLELEKKGWASTGL